MKDKFENFTHIEGILYQHKLEKKVTGENSKNPGTEYITGTIDIATDDAITNIVSVHFSYEPVVKKDKKPNSRYPILNDIIEKKYLTYMDDPTKAIKMRIDSAIDLNEWWDQEDKLVSVKRNEGGFLHITPTLTEKEKERALFSTDIVITNVRLVEADPDSGKKEKAIIKGAIFNFRKELLPVEFTVLSPAGIDYFMNANISSTTPLFTKVKGEQVSIVTVKKIEEPGAFGETYVREIPTSKKEFVVNWALPNPYDWDTEDTITKEEFLKFISDRELSLAEKKQAQADRRAASASGASAFSTASAATKPADQAFNF